jgi:hypothetical protein
MCSIYSVRNHPLFIAGVKTHDQIFAEFLRTFEIGGHVDGQARNSTRDPTYRLIEVIREEFLSYYAGVSVSIDSDAYFDLMMRNAWKL